MQKSFFGRRLRSTLGLLLPVTVAVVLFQMLSGGSLRAPTTTMTYTEFKTALRAEQIQTATVAVDQISGKLADGKLYQTVRVDDPDLLKDLEANKVNATGQVAGNGGIFPFGKSKARVIQGEQTGVTFGNVGGAGAAVDELREITEYLKDPDSFQRLGGRMTKGVVLVGPPGTGKTLLAKATAGEAGAPFFSVSASEFVEMFVGVGASRVRDLLKQAKKAAPSIIFIDELDAIGSQRAGAGAMGAHEEREQTLNQLLAETTYRRLLSVEPH